jgi:hypothetical protein
MADGTRTQIGAGDGSGLEAGAIEPTDSIKI